MAPPASQGSLGPLQRRIPALAGHRSRVMFSDLANSLPDYSWHQLFTALSRLQHLRRIELVAHQWDYEVCFLKGATSTPALSPGPDHTCLEHHESTRR